MGDDFGGIGDKFVQVLIGVLGGAGVKARGWLKLAMLSRRTGWGQVVNLSMVGLYVTLTVAPESIQFAISYTCYLPFNLC